VVAGVSLAIIMNKGGGAFASPVFLKYPDDISPWFVTVTDLNGDGKADVVVPDTKEIAVYMNDGKGKLGAPLTFPAGKAHLVAAGDLTGDHVQSIVVVDDSPSKDEEKSHVYVLRASCR